MMYYPEKMLRVIYGFGVLVGLTTVFCAPVAYAQCDSQVDAGTDPTLTGTLRDTFPADQTTGVPLNTPVRLRYYIQAPEPAVVCVRVDSSSGSCLPGTSSSVGSEIVWQPATSLSPRRRYYVTYQEMSVGSNQITFETGDRNATERLLFRGANEARSDDAPSDPCNVRSVDITVKFDRVPNTGDTSGLSWPDSDIEYVIYQTRGPGISGPRVRDQTRLQRSGSSMVSTAQRTFRLSALESSGPVCFNVQAVNPLGRADGNTTEVCVNPSVGNYFVGCSVGYKSNNSSQAFVAVMALMWTAFRRRRRRHFR
jgi:hypothetical protein